MKRPKEIENEGDLDALDRKILDVLREDGRISIAELGARIGLSKTPCQIRFRRLVDDGYIEGFRATLNPAKLKLDHIAFAEEPVKLRSVTPEPRAFVEDLAEGVLHHRDLIADPDQAAQLFLNIGRGGQMVGMDMGFENPFQIKILVAQKGDDRIRRPCIRPP